MGSFAYVPSKHVPFRDMEAVRRVRSIRREEIEKHPNPDYRIRVYPDADIGFFWIYDMFSRIKEASDRGDRIVIITPNPWPEYRKVAFLINRFRVNCQNLWTFNMDEYADQDGNVAPETWEYGFTYAFKKYFLGEIDPELRPPENQIMGMTTKNVRDYGKTLADLGGADICYSGPGWTGHLAFIEPDSPEFGTDDLDAFKKMSSRIVTLSPFTIAQNSMHGTFGMSGDLTMVPPKAATIGPAEVIGAKHRIQLHAISVHGTTTSWQRMISRLVMHGPVTPRVPESLLQTLRTDAWVSETVAMNIEPHWEKGY
jgi:6-phosphogluconolactonase/glucosamine-6-phosphate isomerase/deaminase